MDEAYAPRVKPTPPKALSPIGGSGYEGGNGGGLAGPALPKRLRASERTFLNIPSRCQVNRSYGVYVPDGMNYSTGPLFDRRFSLGCGALMLIRQEVFEKRRMFATGKTG